MPWVYGWGVTDWINQGCILPHPNPTKEELAPYEYKGEQIK
jgi:hypothetical protein